MVKPEDALLNKEIVQNTIFWRRINTGQSVHLKEALMPYSLGFYSPTLSPPTQFSEKPNLRLLFNLRSIARFSNAGKKIPLDSAVWG